MEDPNSVYISGIREFHTEDALKEYFQQFGGVQKVRPNVRAGTVNIVMLSNASSVSRMTYFFH